MGRLNDEDESSDETDENTDEEAWKPPPDDSDGHWVEIEKGLWQKQPMADSAEIADASVSVDAPCYDLVNIFYLFCRRNKNIRVRAAAQVRKLQSLIIIF